MGRLKEETKSKRKSLNSCYTENNRTVPTISVSFGQAISRKSMNIGGFTDYTGISTQILDKLRDDKQIHSGVNLKCLTCTAFHTNL